MTLKYISFTLLVMSNFSSTPGLGINYSSKQRHGCLSCFWRGHRSVQQRKPQDPAAEGSEHPQGWRETLWHSPFGGTGNLNYKSQGERRLCFVI